MKDFKIGDRVSVRRGGFKKPFKGKVASFNEEYNTVGVQEEGFYSAHADSPFHPCQVRKLIPKKKVVKEARRFFICADTWTLENPLVGLGVRHGETVLAQEVLPGTVTISREDVKNVLSNFMQCVEATSHGDAIETMLERLGIT